MERAVHGCRPICKVRTALPNGQERCSPEDHWETRPEGKWRFVAFPLGAFSVAPSHFVSIPLAFSDVLSFLLTQIGSMAPMSRLCHGRARLLLASASGMWEEGNGGREKTGQERNSVKTLKSRRQQKEREGSCPLLNRPKPPIQ